MLGWIGPVKLGPCSEVCGGRKECCFGVCSIQSVLAATHVGAECNQGLAASAVGPVQGQLHTLKARTREHSGGLDPSRQGLLVGMMGFLLWAVLE